MAQSDIKIPRRKGAAWITQALGSTPKDGNWHRIKTMAVSSAEQTARAWNPPLTTMGGGWEFGYRIVAGTDGPSSELWVRWA